jgi:hypothetical protein
MKKTFTVMLAALLLLATAAFSQEAESRSVRLGNSFIVPEIAESVNTIYKFGSNTSLGTSFETVWEEGGIYQYPGGAVTMSLSSDSNSDSITATGAWTVQIFGLDGEYNPQFETMNIYGTNPAYTTGQYIRIHRFKIVTAGSTGGGVGTIYVGEGAVAAGVPATVYGTIDNGWNQTLMAVYTVPAGKTGVLSHWSVAFGKTTLEALGTLYVRKFGEVFQVKDRVWLLQNWYESGELRPLAIIPEKSDIEIRAKGSVGGTEVSGNFTIFLIDKIIE